MLSKLIFVVLFSLVPTVVVATPTSTSSHLQHHHHHHHHSHKHHHPSTIYNENDKSEMDENELNNIEQTELDTLEIELAMLKRLLSEKVEQQQYQYQYEPEQEQEQPLDTPSASSSSSSSSFLPITHKLKLRNRQSNQNKNIQTNNKAIINSATDDTDESFSSGSSMSASSDGNICTITINGITKTHILKPGDICGDANVKFPSCFPFCDKNLFGPNFPFNNNNNA